MLRSALYRFCSSSTSSWYRFSGFTCSCAASAAGLGAGTDGRGIPAGGFGSAFIDGGAPGAAAIGFGIAGGRPAAGASGLVAWVTPGLAPSGFIEGATDGAGLMLGNSSDIGAGFVAGFGIPGVAPGTGTGVAAAGGAT